VLPVPEIDPLERHAVLEVEGGHELDGGATWLVVARAAVEVDPEIGAVGGTVDQWVADRVNGHLGPESLVLEYTGDLLGRDTAVRQRTSEDRGRPEGGRGQPSRHNAIAHGGLAPDFARL
jgi:hypothetical protein